MSERPQVVLVCGGRGTRLAATLGDLPKVLAPIAGRPLLDHLFADLASLGDADVLLLAGHGGEEVAAAAQRLAPANLHVETLIEERPMGTAGALHGAAQRLQKRFILACGDILTSLDWRRFWDYAARQNEKNESLGTLLVHPSSHPEDSDLLALNDDDRVIRWSRRGEHGAKGFPAALGNAGIAIFQRDLLRYVPQGRPSDVFRDILPALVDRRAKIDGYRTPEYVRDMGTPERLQVVSRDYESGRTKRKADLVLLDRDGVLNVDIDSLARAEDLQLIPGSARGVRRLNEAGIKTAVVTNQSVIARALCTPEELDRIHQRLAELLRLENAGVDRIYHCPHHPETYHSEGLPEMRGPCSCRKPTTGMVEQALADLGGPAWRTVVVGDRTSDMQLAFNAGLAGIGVDTGIGLKDSACPAQPVWTFPNLEAACTWLCGEST